MQTRRKTIFLVFFLPNFGSRWPLFGLPWPSPGLPGLRFFSLDLHESGLNLAVIHFRPKIFPLFFVGGLFTSQIGLVWPRNHHRKISVEILYLMMRMPSQYDLGVQFYVQFCVQLPRSSQSAAQACILSLTYVQYIVALYIMPTTFRRGSTKARRVRYFFCHRQENDICCHL